MLLRIVFRIMLLLTTLALIPAVPLLIILSGVSSAEYVMRGTLDVHGAGGDKLAFGSAYIELLSRMAHLDFGNSTSTGQPARTVVLRSLVESTKVILPAMLLAFAGGTALGLGNRSSRLCAAVLRWFRFAFFIPIVVFSYLLAYILSHMGVEGSSAIRYLAAAVVLAIFPMYIVIQSVNRTVAMIETGSFFRYHRATGFTEGKIWTKFCWRFLAIDYLSFAVHMLVFMFGFLFFVEVPLGIDGLGQRFVASVYRYDYPIIVGFCVITILLIGVGGFIADIARSHLDPRTMFV